MRALLLSRYTNLGATSRYRCYQYIPYLEARGWEITNAPLLDDEYIRKMYSGKTIPIAGVAKNYVQRVNTLLHSRRFDLIWIQQEAFPWVPYFFESLLMRPDIPYVVDYDDPFFHRYDQHSVGLVKLLLGRKIDRVMENASLVVAGNDYLAQRAQQSGAKNIAIVPTVVDTTRYPVTPQPNNDVFTVGWIGSPGNSHYIGYVHDALREFCADNTARIVVIGTREDFRLEGVPMQVLPWSEETEIEQILKFDVGIMPLADNSWERGKCGFKLIQYMAAARPVVGSPIGVNRHIIEHGVNGFQANTAGEWTSSLHALRNDLTLRGTMGMRGRRKIEELYSLQTTASVLESLLRGVLHENESIENGERKKFK